jgi:hypothetical protein
MTTALILIASGVLIGAGLSILWHDLRKRRRSAFVLGRDAAGSADPEIEITISHSSETPRRTVPEPVPQPASSAPPPAVPTPPAAPARAARLTVINADEPRNGARLSLEQRWTSLQPAIAAGVDKVNAVLAPVRLAIGATGEPSWSYKNRGYGAYRRLQLGGESIAWLRLELDTDGRLHASLKAHKEDRDSINAAADAPAEGMNGSRAGDLLSQCLKRAATFAGRQRPSRDDDEEASEEAWKSVDALVAAALSATNGAFAQAGARLVPLAPAAWEAELRRHRMALSVEVNGDDVARMHIERLPHEMEVAVGVREPQLVDLGRRRRVPVAGMTTHVLAELIASCAWPAIARCRETRRQA